MAEKTCSACGETKALSEFHRKKHNADGYHGTCKRCANAYYAKHRKENRDRYLAYEAEWRASHRENVKLAQRKWRAANTELAKERTRVAALKAYRARPYARWTAMEQQQHRDRVNSWRRANPSHGASFRAKRRAAEKRATPVWANSFFIAEAYRLAALRTKLFGFSWHVDHIVPLQHPLVCGLHVESNLNVIPASENQKKHNRFEVA